MKPKMKWGLIAALPVALFLVLGRMLAGALGLSGFAYQLLWIGFTLLGALIGGLIFWFIGRARSKEPRPEDPLEEDLTSRLGEIRRRLAEAKRAGLDRLPIVVLIGPQQSGKSSTILGSDVSAEQLTGDPRSDSDYPPTRTINAWYSD